MFHKLCKYAFHNKCMGIWHFDGIGITFLKRTEESSTSYVNLYFTTCVKNLTFDSVLIELLKELFF